MRKFPYVSNLLKSAVAAIFIIAILPTPALSVDRFESLSTRDVTIPEEPVDIALSPDGNWTFILTTSGEIAVYDRADRLIQTLNAGSGYERMEYDSSRNRLVLAGSGRKLKTILLAMRFDIDGEASPYRGPEGAPVIITVYTDFQCPYCAALGPLLEQVLNKYPKQVAIQFKNYPLRSHRMAMPAASAAMAAEKQGRFWDYHDRVFENYRKLSDDLLISIARDIGLEMEQFEKDRRSVEISNLIKRDIREGTRIGVRGTPTLFVNGLKQVQRSPEALYTAVENELANTPKP